MMRSAIIAGIIFFIAHFAMLVGVTTPEKFYFDEVHYVPAARQMLEPVMPQPMLNPMHPPLAKQLIALSIHSLGDGPLGWRYPAVLFGSLALVAVYLCGLALFAAQGPAIAATLLAFFNQMLFVQSRIAMLDIFALAFSLFAIAAFMHGFRQLRPHRWFALAGAAFGLAIGCKWSGLFALAVCIVIVAAIRLMQGWRTQFADASPEDWYRPDLWPDFRAWHFAACFVLIPAAVYLATFIPLYGFSFREILEAQRRIFSDNTTTAIAGHTYMSSWPSWPLLVRPVWYLFDKIGDDRIAGRGVPRQSADPVAGADSARHLPARLDRDAAGGCIPGAGVLFRPLSRMGAAAANARLHLLLSAGRDHGELRAGLCVKARQHARAGCCGPMLRSALPALSRCCRYRPRSSARRWRRSTA